MRKPAAPAAAPSQRVVRVFVSSTFRDMQAERDELVKQIFPQLRKLCEARGVTWGEVDLRWGITDEQSAEGKVLPICLAEIQRCRPYFIGLLGERYGWVPEAIDPALIAEQPWLAEHRERSVTELEMLHGVLNDPAMADRTFFYFRSPSYVDGLPAEQQSIFREAPTEDEIERFGAEEAQRRAQERQQKLAALKVRIRASGLPVREDYPDPRALGELVLRDLTEIISQLFPEGSEPDPLNREAAEHAAFAASRTGVYIGKSKYFDRLDAHAGGDGPPLVVLGESGIGKSALLANWASNLRVGLPEPSQQPNDPDLVLMHFIGATLQSTDWAAMLRRLIGELTRRFSFPMEIPEEPGALRSAFANCLSIAAKQGRVVIILDGLNQLEDRDGAPDLVWLPPTIPANVRLILSTLPGRPLKELSRRGYPTLKIEPLDPPEREQLIVKYLYQHFKRLRPDQVQRIAGADQAKNPLYLRALLDELRVYGYHGPPLDNRIDHYLTAGSVAELYTKILTRCEQDYERDRPGLVKDAMSLLWAARRGLSEAELLDLLGSPCAPLPQAYWSPLYLQAESFLVNRSGLLGFFHDYVLKAVEARYLPKEVPQRAQATHLRLADYFADRDLGPRKIDELPWQLSQAQAWDRLYALLAEMPFFTAAWEANPLEVRARWAEVEDHSPLRLVDAYRPCIADPLRHLADAHRVALLLESRGHLAEALTIETHLTAHFRQKGDLGSLTRSLISQASLTGSLGDENGELALLKQAERLSRESNNVAGLAAVLNNQAQILSNHGHPQAMTLFEEVKCLCRSLGDAMGVAASLSNQAGIYWRRGDLDRALSRLEEVEGIYRENASPLGLAGVYGNRAMILRDREKLDEAQAMAAKEEREYRNYGDLPGLARSLWRQAGILQDRGDLNGALALLKTVELIYRDASALSGLVDVVRDEAVMLADLGQTSAALAALKQAEGLCREMRDIYSLTRTLEYQAEFFTRVLFQPAAALSVAEEAYRLATQHGLSEAAQRSTKATMDGVLRVARPLRGEAFIGAGEPSALPVDAKQDHAPPHQVRPEAHRASTMVASRTTPLVRPESEPSHASPAQVGRTCPRADSSTANGAAASTSVYSGREQALRSQPESQTQHFPTAVDAGKAAQRTDEDEDELTMADHLEEFSARLLVIGIAWVLGSVVAGMFPVAPNWSRASLLEAPVFGLLLSSPIVAFEVWAFTAPALVRKERWILAAAMFGLPLITGALAVAFWPIELSWVHLLGGEVRPGRLAAKGIIVLLSIALSCGLAGIARQAKAQADVLRSSIRVMVLVSIALALGPAVMSAVVLGLVELLMLGLSIALMKVLRRPTMQRTGVE